MELCRANESSSLHLPCPIRGIGSNLDEQSNHNSRADKRHKETTMRRFRPSLSGLSIVFALGLALWEWYFFFMAGTHLLGSWEGSLGFFTPNRFGLNVAWL